MNAYFIKFYHGILLATVCFSVAAGSYDIKIVAEIGNNKAKEIAFVDAAINNIDSLMREIDPHVDVVLINPQHDGVEQIAQILANQKDVDAIHILSHGRSGILNLGTTKLTAVSMLSNHADEMAVIRDALSQNADILIYGCNFAQDVIGERAVEQLAAATGADVVASDNLTGALALGGDWVMEIQSGTIETEQITAKSWHGVLEPFVIDVTGITPTVSGTGVGDTALWLNAGTVGTNTIDLKATVISGDPGAKVIFNNSGGDIRVRTQAIAEATVRWEAFEAGTATPVSGEPTFLVRDVDGAGGVPESLETIAASLVDLNKYIVRTDTNLAVSKINGTIRASGMEDAPNAQVTTYEQSWISYTWNEVSSWEVTYESYEDIAHDYIHDGNASSVIDTNNDFEGDPALPVVFITSKLSANVTNSAAYSVSGTCTDGDGNVTVTITGAGTPPPGQAVSCTTAATWSTIFDVSLIPDGVNALTINASQTDSLSNTVNAPTVQLNKIGPVSAANTTIDTNPASVVADGTTSTISVQAIDANGIHLTTGDDAVELFTTGSAALSVVTDVGDGTYTATISNLIEEPVTITGTINTLAITDTAAVTFTPVIFTINTIADAAVNENSAYTSETPAITGAPIGALTYTLSGADADDFIIAPSTGVVSMVARDFENPVDANLDNVYELTITATDTLANSDSETWNVTVQDVDEISPAVDIINVPASSNFLPFNITFEFSEDVTGFVLADISIGNGSADTFVVVDGNTYTANITPDGLGDVTIDVDAGVAQDAALNVNTAAAQAVVTFDNDTDNDGVLDVFECPLGPPNCTDTDGDGTADYQDIDSDGDGIDDAVEGAGDSDGDGIPDYVDVGATGDSDGDGIPDSVECPAYPGCPDSDSDSQPDYTETDSDGDGIKDAVEAGVDPTQPLNTDADITADLKPDYQDTDSDEDGALDSDAAEGVGDDDADGIPNYVDAVSAGPGAGDSDGDGIADIIECELYPLCADSNTDSTPDYMQADSDGDGISDTVEAGTTLNDADNDGIDDTFDITITGLVPLLGLDQNGDGIDDTHPLDSDGDGTPDYQDTDSDNDGTNDATEAGFDIDADGIPDYLDASIGDASGTDIIGSGDSDGDGISDNDECPVGLPCLDADQDGIPDYMDANHQDGPRGNLDGDGDLNYLDPDDDNDGIPDAVEDLNNDGDDNPFTSPNDTDGDGIADYQDADSDNDGIGDAVEGIVDTDGDGIPDYLDVAVSAANTTISVSVASVSADGSTITITVQAKDANGNNFTVSGGTVVLTEDGSATISAVTDNSNGTYTATISSQVAETVTISGTIVGNAITDTAVVTFTAVAAPASGGGGGGSNNPVYVLLLLLILVTLRHKHRAVF